MSSRPATILIIDDQPEVVNLLTEVLKRDGYNVVDSTRAEQAPALIQAIPSLDIIVSSLTVAKTSGVDLIRQACRSRPELRAVFMMTESDNVTCRRSDPVLKKPLDLATFTEIVRRTLDEPSPPPAIDWAGPERRRRVPALR
jgi:DNA-binding NtrC family response regulator